MKMTQLIIILMTCSIPVVAMENIKEMSSVKKMLRSAEEAMMKINLSDSGDAGTLHEVEIPVRLARVIGAYIEDTELDGGWRCLPDVTLAEWRLIEPHLERVYGITHGHPDAAHLRKEIVAELEKLDARSSIELICALDYINIPLLLEIACDVVKKSDCGKYTFDQIMSLPLDMGNRIIVHTILRLGGPIAPREHAVCRGHEDGVFSVCVTKSGKIVSVSRDNTIRVRDMKGKELAVCRGHADRVYSVCVTKDDKIVSGSKDKTVRVWDMEGKELAVCLGHGDIVNSVCVTPDGKHIVSGSSDATVRVWDLEGKEVAVCRGHGDRVWSVCVTRDGKIVSGSSDVTVRVWDMKGNQLAICRGHVTEDGKMVTDRRAWDMEGNQVVWRGHGDKVNSVCATKDGRIVSGSRDKTVRVWDMKGKELAVCRGHEGPINSVCATNDGWIVSGSDDKTLRVWDMKGKELAVCRGNKYGVTSVCATKDGTIVSGSFDKTVRLWDISLIARIDRMDEGRAQAIWELLQRVSQQGAIDKPKLWLEIEKILKEEIVVAQASNHNNNNN